MHRNHYRIHTPLHNADICKDIDRKNHHAWNRAEWHLFNTCKMKRCNCCKKDKAIELFLENNKEFKTCIDCRNHSRNWREKNKELCSLYNKTYNNKKNNNIRSQIQRRNDMGKSWKVAHRSHQTMRIIWFALHWRTKKMFSLHKFATIMGFRKFK